jgi:hypothetical protein
MILLSYIYLLLLINNNNIMHVDGYGMSEYAKIVEALLKLSLDRNGSEITIFCPDSKSLYLLIN